jgi:hypothetical protein
MGQEGVGGALTVTKFFVVSIDPVAVATVSGAKSRPNSPSYGPGHTGKPTMRHVIAFRPYLRVAACAAAMVAVAACTTMPELNEVKLVPEMRTLLPSNSNTYSNATAMRSLRPVGPEDLVDGQGMCAGAPGPVAATEGGPAAADGQLQMVRPVALEMTECEVARALGAPSSADVGSNERGQRSLVLTYMTGDRPGIYRFAAGRLVSIERGAEPPAPAKPDKKTGKKPAPAKKPTRTGA